MIIVPGVRGPAIPPWNIYACIADGLFDAPSLPKRQEPNAPWECNQRNVAITVRPQNGGLDPKYLSVALHMIHRTLGDYKVPNVQMVGYATFQTVVRRRLQIEVTYQGTAPAVVEGPEVLPEDTTVGATY